MELVYTEYPVVHAEVVVGLRGKDGSQFSTRDVTTHLQELNRERHTGNLPEMTFKVFSGYAPYSLPNGVNSLEVVENVALLHLDYNPTSQGEERLDTFGWYLQRLMEKFEQKVAYAHFASNGGHSMLRFELTEGEKKEPTN